MQRRTVLAAAAWPLALRAQPAATVLLLRHAQTEPGIGDPPGFVPGQCNTQRNLSDAGREQARKLGAALRLRGLTPQRVRSSRWCRCLDTARLAFGSVEPWPALDSFFGARDRVDAQTTDLRHALAALPGGRVEAWVTHQVNISALVGGGAAMGEVLVLRAGEVVERIITAP